MHTPLVTTHFPQVHIVLSEVSNDSDGVEVDCDSDPDEEEELVEEEDLSDTDPEDEWNSPQAV